MAKTGDPIGKIVIGKTGRIVEVKLPHRTVCYNSVLSLEVVERVLDTEVTIEGVWRVISEEGDDGKGESDQSREGLRN